MKATLGALAVLLLFAVSASYAQQKPTVIRVGYFPNITHAQALVGRANGQFDKALGSGVQIEWKAFNAGPAAIEALFAGAIDMTYVGPNPAVTGYVRSQGEAVRVIAGAASGGASLVVRQGAGIQKATDFHGKKVATPQLGNTQDVALRSWMHANGLVTREKGGDVQVLPIANPDQLTLFQRGQIDAAWAPEPWAARLVHDGGGRIFIDERDLWPNRQFVITDLIVSPKFLKQHPDIVKNFLRVHVELTQWIDKNQAQAKQIMNQQLRKEIGKPLPPEILDDAFSRMQVTYDPIRSSLLKSTQQAFDEGFLGRTQPDISGLYDLTLLNEVLQEKEGETLTMTNYVLDLFNRSIGGGRVLPEHDELSEQAKPKKDVPVELGPRLGLGPGIGTPQPQTPARKESICLSGVFRSYTNSRGSFTPALQNIDLEIEQGEFVCIVGPSGCGKSTLLHLVAGLDRPTTGEIMVDGAPVNGPGTDRILLFQELGLFPWLTVRQNVEFGLKMAGVSKEERKDRARVFIRMVHLSHFEDHYIHQLSGGMKQRVALARSLALKPKILLMDEPFAALDAQTRDLLHDELERIWKETSPTIVFVTHNVREAVRLGDRVLLMSFRPGRIKSQFQVTLNRPRHVEDSDVAYLSKEILGQLRAEIDRSFNAEYSREEKR